MQKEENKTIKPLFDTFAKDLGYKDYKELKDALGKEETGRGNKGSMGNIGAIGGAGTGFLGGREVGSGFKVGVTKRLAAGKGVKESVKGGFGEFKQSLSLENIKRRGLEKTFGGSGFISSFARGKLKKKYAGKDSEKSEDISESSETSPSKKVEGTSNDYITIIAKESMAIPPMARDVNVMRQNLQKLVKLWGGKSATKKDSESGEKVPPKSIDEANARIDGTKERKEDISFFAEQDAKEAEIEAARQKGEEKSTTPVPEKKEEEKGNFLDSIISLFSRGFMKAIRFVFNPKMIMKVFSKVFVPLAIIGSLFSGIMTGFKKYQETGSFSEAIKSALSGMLSFIPNLILGEETTKKLFDSITSFFDPITSTISNIFGGLKDFFVGLFGGKVDVKDESKKEADKVTPEKPAGKVDVTGKVETADKVKTPSSETPALPAPTTPTKEPTKSKKLEDTRSPERKKAHEQEQARAEVESLQFAEADLQALYKDWRNEKNQITQKLMSDPRYPEGIIDDPLSPEYPKELKEIDEKYEKHIGIKKAEIDRIKKVPGVKEELKRQEYEEMDVDKFKPPTKVSGSKFTTTETTSVSGGGTTTRSLARSPAAKKAEKELKDLDDKQAAERKVLVDKLKSEGKIKGRFATSKDYAENPELSALKQKQDAERVEIVRKIDEGTQLQTTKTGGSSGGGSVSASGSSASPESGSVSASGGASSGGVSATPTTPSGGEVSQASSEVAESQRMESAADSGSVVNAPTTNNNTSSSQNGKSKPSSVYNEDLIATLDSY